MRLDVAFDERRALCQGGLLRNDAGQLANLLGEVVAALRQAGELGHQVDVCIVADSHRAQADLVLAHARHEVVVLNLGAAAIGNQHHVLQVSRDGPHHVFAFVQRLIDIGSAFSLQG